MARKNNTVGLANWIIRIALVLVMFLSFIDSAQAVLKGSTTLDNVLGLAALLAAVFLLIGGFLRKHTTTVISALVLTVVFVISIIYQWSGVDTNFALLLLMAGSALYFAAAGNGR